MTHCLERRLIGADLIEVYKIINGIDSVYKLFHKTRTKWTFNEKR